MDNQTPVQQPIHPPDHATLRDQLQSLVIHDMLGPANGPEELVNERNVRGRYIVGLLAPRGQSALPEDQFAEDTTYDELLAGDLDSEGAAEEEEVSTEGRPSRVTASMLPSSIGLTFAVDGGAQALEITARWGQYKRVAMEEEQYKNKDGAYRRLWQRVPREGVSPSVPLQEGRMETWRPAPEEQPDVYVEGLIRRRRIPSGLDDEEVEQWIVTLFLVNGQEEKPPKDQYWIFQPELIVRSPDGDAIFRRRPNPVDRNNPEQQAMAMLYRRQVEFAAGHGVAVHAELDPTAFDRAVELRTQVVPSYDIPQTTPPTPEEIPALADLTLDMQRLSELETGQFGPHLAALPAAYQAWIDHLRNRVERVLHRDARTQGDAENLSGSTASHEKFEEDSSRQGAKRSGRVWRFCVFA